MKRYPLGTVIGGLVGLPAGLFGVGFGVLVGALVDQAVVQVRERRSLTRRLERPLAESEPEIPTDTAILVLAFVVAGDLPRPALEPLLRRIDELCGPSAARLRRLLRLAGEGPALAMHANSGELAELLRRRMPREQRETVIGLLLSVAGEPARVRRVAEHMGVTRRRYLELRAPYRALDPRACRILGVSPDCALEDVKRAYRTLAAQFHPDAGAGLDPEQRRQAEQAYLTVQAAYHGLLREFET